MLLECAGISWGNSMTFSSFQSPALLSLSACSPNASPKHGRCLLPNTLLSEPLAVLASGCSFSTCALVPSESAPVYRSVGVSTLDAIMFAFHFFLSVRSWGGGAGAVFCQVSVHLCSHYRVPHAGGRLRWTHRSGGARLASMRGPGRARGPIPEPPHPLRTKRPFSTFGGSTPYQERLYVTALVH